MLFILYAIWGFILLVAYFVLSYINQPSVAFDDRGTYISERTDTTYRSRSHRGGGGLGAIATAGAAGAGLAALRRRSRSRSGSRRRASGGRHDAMSSHYSSHLTDSYVDEKHGQKQNTWRSRLLGAGAAAGGILAIKSLFGGRKKKHTVTETGSDVSYSRPIGQSEVTQTDLSRLEEGRAPASPARDHWRRVEEREAAQAAAMGASPLRQGHHPTRSATSIDSFDSRTSISEEHASRPRESHGLRDGVAAMGVLGYLRYSLSRKKKEDEHVAAVKQQDIEEERIARQNSARRKYTADGVPPRRTHTAPSTIYSDTEISTMTPAPARPHHQRSMTDLAQPQTGAGPSVRPVPPSGDAHGVLSDSGSEAYVSGGGGRHRRHRNAGSGALAAGAAAGAMSTGSPSRRDHSQRRSSKDDSSASRPVSVKVKMHNDGRHVTLRRLNEEEAAAEREARKKERRKSRAGSTSSLGNSENRARWRRTEAMEAAQAQEMAQHGAAPLPMPEPMVSPPPGPPTASGHHINLPPPPPIPGAGGSVLSSPYGGGTETDVSNFDSNRKRRRAERAQQAKAGKSGKSVDFQ